MSSPHSRPLSSRRLGLIQQAVGALGRPEAVDVAVRVLAEALRVRWAYVSERLHDDPSQARTVAFWADGALQPETTYPLAGTPCADVYDRLACYVGEGVQGAYPDDAMLVDMGAESYAGLPLTDEGGRAWGHLAVMHDAPFVPSEDDRATLALFASLVGTELSRRQSSEDRRRVERLLMASERRETLGLLAGTIAHDLNNLLVGVTANVDLARLDLPEGSPALPRLDAIQETGLRAADLARQMLAYAGRGRFEIGPVDLARVARDTVELLRTSLPPGVALEATLPDGLPAVHGEATQLAQVVLNLVMNGVEALHGAPGRVTVAIRTARFDPSRARCQILTREAGAGEWLSLEVEDTGAGMDEATLQRVFDPFFTTKPRGNGLGLAAVGGIVLGHRGALQVRSVLGEGSSFRVLLPVTDAPVAPRVEASPAARLPDGLRVLVVDDEPAVRSVLDAVLRRAGVEVILAADGAAALEALAEDSFDVVLIDLSMPGVGGGEVIEWMARGAASTPVVLMSGYDRAELDREFGARVAGFLQKPFTVADALGVLSAALAV